MAIQNIKVMLSVNAASLANPGQNLGTFDEILSLNDIDKESEGLALQQIVYKLKEVENFYSHTGITFSIKGRQYAMDCGMAPQLYVYAQIQFSSDMMSGEKDAFMDKIQAMIR